MSSFWTKIRLQGVSIVTLASNFQSEFGVLQFDYFVDLLQCETQLSECQTDLESERDSVSVARFRDGSTLTICELKSECRVVVQVD